MKLFRSLGGMLSVVLLLGVLVSSAPAGAQSLTALQLERTLSISNILTTFPPPPLPAATFAAITSGALEIREQFNFNPQSNTLTSTLFLVAGAAPNPTVLSQLPFSSFIVISTTAIDKIYLSNFPVPSVTIVGTVIQTTAPPAGGISTFSFGYSSDKPPKISNVIETAGGFGVLYSASGQATFTITQPATGGGGGGTGVTVVVNGVTSTAPTFQTVGSLITLDASASKSANAGALTFSWSLAPGSPSAAINVTSNGVAQVQLGSGKGAYVIVLKVTDSTGASSTANITIQFI